MRDLVEIILTQCEDSSSFCRCRKKINHLNKSLLTGLFTIIYEY